jgi:hypothetical protein
MEQVKERQALRKAQLEAEKRAREEEEQTAREEPNAGTQADADAKAKAEADAKAKKEADEKAKAEADAKAKAEADAKAKAEADARAKAEADARAKAEADARAKAEADARAKKEADAKANTEANAKRQEDAKKIVGVNDGNALTSNSVAKLAMYFDFTTTWNSLPQIDVNKFAEKFADVMNIVFKNLRKCQTKSIVDAGKRLMLGFTILVCMTITMFSFLYIVHVNDKECNVNGFYEIYTFFKLVFAFTVYGVLTEYFSDIFDLRSRLCIVSLLCVLVIFLVPDCHPVGFNTKDKANDEVLRSFDHYMHEKGLHYHALRPSFDLIALRRKCALGVSKRHLTEECIETLQNVFEDVSNTVEPALVQVFKMPHLGIPQKVRMVAYKRSPHNNKLEVQTLDAFAYKNVHEILPNEDKIIPMLPFMHRKMQNGHVYLNHYKSILRMLKISQKAQEMGITLMNNAHVNALLQGLLSWVGKPWLGLLAGSIAQAGLYQTLPLDQLLQISEWFKPLPEIPTEVVEHLKKSLGDGDEQYEYYADEQFNLDILLRTDKKWLPDPNETLRTVVDYISSRFPNYSHESYVNYTEEYKNKLFENCPFKNTSEGVQLFQNCKITPVLCEKMNEQLKTELEQIRVNYRNIVSSLKSNLKNCNQSLQSAKSENNATPVVCEECVCVQPPPVDCNPFCDARPCPDKCRSTIKQCKEMLNITDPPLEPQKYKHDTFEDYMKDYVNNIPNMVYNNIQSMMAYVVAAGVGVATLFSFQLLETQRQRLISENMPYDPNTGRVYGMHRHLAAEFGQMLVDITGGTGSFFGGCMSAVVSTVSSAVGTGLRMMGVLSAAPETAISGGELAAAYGRALELSRNQYSYWFTALRFTLYGGILTWRMIMQVTQIAYTMSSQVLVPLSRMMTGRLF